jgi:hypothetical protein
MRSALSLAAIGCAALLVQPIPAAAQTAPARPVPTPCRRSRQKQTRSSPRRGARISLLRSLWLDHALLAVQIEQPERAAGWLGHHLDPAPVLARRVASQHQP